jgi:hypothetical protein
MRALRGDREGPWDLAAERTVVKNHEIEDLSRARSRAPGLHLPRVNHDMTMIVGCTCGWRTPACVTDSDDAFSMHVAIARVAEGSQQ